MTTAFDVDRMPPQISTCVRLKLLNKFGRICLRRSSPGSRLNSNQEECMTTEDPRRLVWVAVCEADNMSCEASPPRESIEIPLKLPLDLSCLDCSVCSKDQFNEIPDGHLSEAV